MANGIMFKIDEQQSGMPEVISEETFINLLELNVTEDDDLEDDGLTFAE